MPNHAYRLLFTLLLCFFVFIAKATTQLSPDTIVYHSLHDLVIDKVSKKKSTDFGIKFSLSSTSVSINKFWRFKPGDSIQWKNSAYSDQHWSTFAEFAAQNIPVAKPINSNDSEINDEEEDSKPKRKRKKDPQLIAFEKKWLFRQGYFKEIYAKNPIGWFRTHIKIPEALIGKPLALEVRQSGASEIYLDGKKIVEYGKVSSKASEEIRHNPHELPVPFSLMDTGLHVLSIRYSDHSTIQEGFKISIDEMNESVASYTTYTKFVMGFPVALFGFFAALFLVHLLIYLFERSKTFNLFYSFFVGSMALIFLLPVVYFNIHNPDISDKIHFYSDFILPVYLITLISLLYVLFKDMKSKFYLFQVLISILVTLLIIFENDYQSSLTGILALLVYIDSFRLSLKALNRKQEGARYVGAGVLGSTVFFFLGFIWLVFGAFWASSSAEEAGVVILLIGFFTFIALAIMSLPISVTIYLAYDFSKTNQGLIKQIENVKELSRQNLEKEQEKQQILADQKSELETQVAHRTAEVVEQNRIISIKNQEVKESLQYASRIQSAILPSLEKLRLTIPDCDCLLKPKEVVSGDFYFVHQFEDKVLFAVIDCTGHGVPGALMSMIGSMMLNQIVVEREINSPAEILAEMNRWIHETLKQNLHGLGTQDGMDAAIAVFEPQSRTLTYAGAMRPLYLIQNIQQEAELNEIKGTKKSIGGDHLDRKIHFSEVTLTLNQGDVIYLFSDGYADQFGGSMGKKLMLKNFKNMLLGMAQLPMDKQILLLEERFEEWRGNHEQIDDVCVMGLRIP